MHAPSRLVQLISMPQSMGICIEAKSDDAGGLYQPLTFAEGVRIFVPQEQMNDAIELLKNSGYEG